MPDYFGEERSDAWCLRKLGKSEFVRKTSYDRGSVMEKGLQIGNITLGVVKVF